MLELRIKVDMKGSGRKLRVLENRYEKKNQHLPSPLQAILQKYTYLSPVYLSGGKRERETNYLNHTLDLFYIPYELIQSDFLMQC